MSVNVIEVRASPDEVFAVLVDPYAYGFWVVGPDRVITASDDWPRVGATFRHETTWGPLKVRDETELEEIDPPRRIVLCAKIRPFGVIARIGITLETSRNGTMLTMDEIPTRGPWRVAWNPVFDRLMWVRNVQALERFKALAEELADVGVAARLTESEEPGAKTLAGMATGLAFWAASAVRGERIFHPVGEAFEADLQMEPDAGVALFAGDATSPRRALVRVSKGVGLPGPLPDVYGVAIKIPDAWEDAADQDLLLATSGNGPVGRHVLRPARAPRGRFSSILPYASGGRTFVFGARAEDGGTIGAASGTRIVLETATRTGTWHRVATVTLRTHFTGDVSFDPWNTGPDLVPDGVINALRRPAYQGSREGRDAPVPTDRAHAVTRTD